MDQEFSILSFALKVFIIIDAPGCLPCIAPFIFGLPKEKRFHFMLRELIIAFSIGTFFIIMGEYLFQLINLPMWTIQIAGGILLMVISKDFIFARPSTMKAKKDSVERIVFPVATPLISGPGTISMLLIILHKTSSRIITMTAFAIGFIPSAIIYLSSIYFMKYVSAQIANSITIFAGVVTLHIGVKILMSGISVLPI